MDRRVETGDLLRLARGAGQDIAVWAHVPITSLAEWRHKLTATPRPAGVVYRSSGSTGGGSELAYSSDVIAGAVRRLQEALRLTPLSSGMRVAMCFGYGCFPPADYYQRGLVALDCDVLPLGSGRNLPTEYKCEWLARAPVNVLFGMPSYLLQIGDVLREQRALDPVRNSLRFVVSGGEPLGPRLLTAVEEMFRVRAFDHYGMLEAPMIAGSCSEGSLHVSREYYSEVLVKGEVQSQGRGELLLSSTSSWPGLLQLRLRTGDDVTLSQGQCACGWSGQLVVVHGRRDDDRKIKGVRVSLSELHRELMSIPVIDYYLEVKRDRAGAETATLQVDGTMAKELVERAVRKVCPVGVDVRIVRGLSVPTGATGKPLRFIDARDAESI